MDRSMQITTLPSALAFMPSSLALQIEKLLNTK